jgi:hypothetical protein
MKTRVFVDIVVLSLILLVGTYSYASRKKATIDPEVIYSVLTGTWIKRDYDDDRNAKIIINADGSFIFNKVPLL